MRILSSFRDYYDRVQAQGQDADVLFRREPSRLALSADGLPPLPWLAQHVGSGYRGRLLGPVAVRVGPERKHSYGTSSWDRYYEEAFVLLAGKAYPIWVNRHYGKAYDASARQVTTGEAITIPAYARDRVEQGGPDIDSLARSYEAHARTSGSGNPDLAFVVKRLDKPEDAHEAKARRDQAAAREHVLAYDWTDVQLQLDSPVAVLMAMPLDGYGYEHALRTRKEQKSLVLVNPCLEDLQFARVRDPFSAFQDIASFIGGIMPGRQSPMITLSDRTQVVKKGFDPVYGFRTRPSA
jgi:hypothetical protein